MKIQISLILCIFCK